jgi:hypothetical protein
MAYEAMFATLDSSQQTPTQENHSFSLRNTLREQPSDARTGKVKRSRGIRTMGKKVLHPSRRSVVVRKRVGSASGTREILRRCARGGAGIMEKNCVRSVCTGRCVCSISIRRTCRTMLPMRSDARRCTSGLRRRCGRRPATLGNRASRGIIACRVRRMRDLGNNGCGGGHGG